jgi:hypothetical protein
VLVHARIHAGIEVNIEADSGDFDLCSFRALINPALTTKFQEAGRMWECLMDTWGRRNRWCNQRRCWQVEVVLVLGMSS